MPYINSVNDVKREADSIKSDIPRAMTNRALNGLQKRNRRMLNSASSMGLKSNIRKAARIEYRSINKRIRARRKQIRD